MCSLKESFFLLLALYLLFIPISTWAHSSTNQNSKKDFVKHPLVFVQHRETFRSDLCPSKKIPTSQCFLSLAKNAAKEITNSDSQNFANLFITISQSYFDSATLTNQSIATITNPSLRGIALTYLAQLYLREENISLSLDIIARALEHTNVSPQAYVNTWLNILIADLFTALGQDSESKKHLNQALETLPLVEEHNTRSELYSLIAQTKLKNGHETESKETLTLAVVEARKVRDPYLKSLAFSFNSLGYYQLGLLPDSISYQELANQYAQRASPSSRMVALAFLSSVQAKTGQLEAAISSLNKTIKILVLVRSPYHRALSFAFLTQTLFFTR